MARGDHMGIINSVTCKSCKYHAETRQGPGVVLYKQLKDTEKAILSGEIECEEARECLQNGGSLQNVAAYLCPECKEFVTSVHYFCFKKIRELPSGMIEGEFIFPFGRPRCKTCDTELIHIPNIRSSYVKCPKCGGDLNAKKKGYYD